MWNLIFIKIIAVDKVLILEKTLEIRIYYHPFLKFFKYFLTFRDLNGYVFWHFLVPYLHCYHITWWCSLYTFLLDTINKLWYQDYLWQNKCLKQWKTIIVIEKTGFAKLGVIFLGTFPRLIIRNFVQKKLP